jgi:type VI secretion system FHA domain protein
LELMRAAGAALRSMITGLRATQAARQAVLDGFRIRGGDGSNSPLKSSIDDIHALEDLLGIGRRPELPPALAVSQELTELATHERAIVSAMRTAVRDLLAGIEPARLWAATEKGGGLALLPQHRKARAWEAYEQRHGAIVQGLDDDFESVFGRTFARSYEIALAEARQQASRRAR